MRRDGYHQGDHEHQPYFGLHDLSFSSLLYIHFNFPVRPGVTRKRCVVMITSIAAGVAIIIIAARDAGNIILPAGVDSW